MTKAKFKKNQRLKNVGTATALTITLVTSNVSTLVNAATLDAEVNIVTSSVEAEAIKQEAVIEEQATESQEEATIIQEETGVQEQEAEVQEVAEKSTVGSFDLSKWDYDEYSSSQFIVLNKYNGSATDIVIPGEINGLSVKMRTLECLSDIKSTVTSITFKEENGKKVLAADYITEGNFKDYTALKSVDFSGLDTSYSSGINMNHMFSGCTSLESVNFSGVDTSKVIYMSNMFLGCSNLTDIKFGDKFITSNVTTMSGMFRGCSSMKSLDLYNFNTEQVKNMSYMFKDCSSLTTIDLSSFNTDQVTNMSYMFDGCRSFTDLDVSMFNAAKVQNMRYMFNDCESLTTLDLSNFNAKEVTNMDNVFKGCRSLTNLDLSSFHTSKVTTMINLFLGCSSLTDIYFGDNFNTAEVTKMNNMFKDCASLNSLDLSGFDTSKVEVMSYMFSNSGVANLDLSSFDTSQVTDMQRMFYNAENLKNINFGDKFTASAATNMAYMFCDSALESLDLSKFNTSQVTNMSYMFAGMGNIHILDLSSFNLDNVTADNMKNMFKKNITGDSAGNITETDSSVAEKQLLVISANPKLLAYNYEADSCLPLTITLDANGGEFENGDQVYTPYTFNVVDYLDESLLEQEILDAISALPAPTREGYTFVSWEANKGTTRNNASILDKLNGVYYANWKAESTGNPDGDTSTPGGDAGNLGGDTSTPGGDAGNPGGDTSTPGGDEGNPGGDTSTPGGDEGNPGGDTSTPGGDAGNPGGDTSTPGGSAGSPGGDTSTPGGEEETPEEDAVLPEGDSENPDGSIVVPEANVNPSTGDAGVLGYLGLGVTSVLGMLLTSKKKKK
ncbi:BspA family leucine-rich repeat surface protein [Alloiococcus sp. CFN-8]|uniref:BspA family leucine-rich repeat surface protein n=1 Tax=Alloiococcus sp. CFN-8 TaxID=3416081 RepID=UPI003CE9DD1B